MENNKPLGVFILCSLSMVLRKTITYSQPNYKAFIMKTNLYELVVKSC